MKSKLKAMLFPHHKAYAFLIFACAAGYIWVFRASQFDLTKETFVVCPMKHIAHIPCPSCGSTRAAVSFLNGDIAGALAWNPIGLVLVLIMAVSPLWAAYDLITGKKSLIDFYYRSEHFFRRKKVAITFGLLIAGNWIWNIYKGL